MLKVKFWFILVCRYVEIEPAGQSLPGAGSGKTAPVLVFWQLSRLNAAHQKARASGPPRGTGGTSWLPPGEVGTFCPSGHRGSIAIYQSDGVGRDRPPVEVQHETGRDFRRWRRSLRPCMRSRFRTPGCREPGMRAKPAAPEPRLP